MDKYTNEELLRLASEDKGSVSCESEKNAVKIACKNSNPQNPGKACTDALKELAACLDND